MVNRAALGLGVYGTISIVLFSFIAEKEFTDSFFVSIPIAILTGALLFINVYISEEFEKRFVGDRDDHTWCPFFWTMSFIIGTLMGSVLCWVNQALMWNLYVAVVLWAGLYGFSHSTSHAVSMNRKFLDTAKLGDLKDKEIYMEWVKLEHDVNQTAFRNYISIISLLVTGGIIGYFLYKGDFWSPGMQDTVIVTIWAVIGLWFGILGPIQQIMYELRNKLRILGTSG